MRDMNIRGSFCLTHIFPELYRYLNALVLLIETPPPPRFLSRYPPPPQKKKVMSGKELQHGAYKLRRGVGGRGGASYQKPPSTSSSFQICPSLFYPQHWLTAYSAMQERLCPTQKYYWIKWRTLLWTDPFWYACLSTPLPMFPYTLSKGGNRMHWYQFSIQTTHFMLLHPCPPPINIDEASRKRNGNILFFVLEIPQPF